jgi:hypothetical protein
MDARQQLQGSFLKFLWYVWTRLLLLPEPTRVQKDIARFLQSGGKRRFIQAFRGVGKTFLTAAYVVWRLWKNPDLKVVIVSANEAFAQEIATFIKQIIDHDAGDDLWAELRARSGQRQSTLVFDVGPAKADKSPSVKAVGITGQLTGSRGDLVISDDVEVVKNSETETMREKLDNKTKEYAAILKPGGEIVYLGTPQSEQSIYRGLPEKGYEVRIWPSRYPLANKLQNYRGFLAPMLQQDIDENPELMRPVSSLLGGAPTDPERFDDMDLIERETEYRQAGFLLQFQLDTTLSDAERYPLKTRDLIVTDLDKKVAPGHLIWSSDPDLAIRDIENVGFDGDRLYRPMRHQTEMLPYTGAVMHIDPSGRGRDRTTYVVTKFLNGFVFVTAWGGFTDGYSPETLSELAKISARHEVNTIVTEDNFGDGMFAALLETHVNALRPCRIEGMKVTGMKETRIITWLEPALKQHRLVMDLSVLRADLLSPAAHRGLFQLTHICDARGALKHDDMVDVLSMGVRYWSEYLNADSRKAEQERIERIERENEARFFTGTSVFAAMERRKGGLKARRGVGRPSKRRR